MNPADALPEDWGMYYDGVWMKHTKHGVGQINVIGGDLHFRKSPGCEPIIVKAKYLSCWWPRAGAFNCGDHAIYIARRAIRNMRKSAVAGDHYYVSWGSPYGKDVMMMLKGGPNYISPDEADRILRAGNMQSVAVTRDIIFTQCELDPEKVSVIFKGMEMGTWSANEGFIPLFSGSPFTPRILRQLEEAP